MFGLGTLINAGGILVGGILGLLVGKGLKERFQQILMTALGLSTIFISVAGLLSEMFTVEGGRLSAGGSMMLIASLVIGGLIGEAIDIERRLEQFGEWLKRKTGSSGDGRFTEGFVTASLTVCVGAMAVIGAINDGLSGDISVLVTKAILDLVTIMVLTAAYGKGCLFSAIPVVIFQGLITLLARLIQPIMTDGALSNLSLVGSALIACVGINLMFGKKVKVANLLPSILLAVVCAFIPVL